jgi:outer membrane scaffolding protein for murein synthesis (MipA/OmpV family)
MKLLFCIFLLIQSIGVIAQSNNEVTFEQAKRLLAAEREQIFTEALQLSASQTTVFHGIFVDYNKEKKELDDVLIKKFVKYAEDYQTMSSKNMSEFIKGTESFQRKDLQLRKKYYKILQDKISIEVAVRFYEVDDLISTMLRVNILSSLPFINKSIQP